MTGLERRASLFAIAAHSAVCQVRKYTGEPYWHHPAEVARIVAEAGGTPEMIAAAWLHDVLEDTQVRPDLLGVLFGEQVQRLVEAVTDVSRPEDGNRAARKALDRAHLAAAPPEAKTIKLADLLDNTRSIVARDPGFARVYMAEKAALLAVLREGDERLWSLAAEKLRDYGLEVP